MNKKKYTCIMITLVQALSEKIRNHYKISYKEATELLYKSKLYKTLEKEETKMWYYSSNELFKMFKEEKEIGKYTIYGV